MSFILDEKFSLIIHHLERSYDKAPVNLRGIYSAKLLDLSMDIDIAITRYEYIDSSLRTRKMLDNIELQIVVLIKQLKRIYKHRRNCISKYRYNKIIDLSTECYKIIGGLKKKIK